MAASGDEQTIGQRTIARIVQLAPGAESRDAQRVIEIDARGHRCPIPTLRLRRALETAPAGVLVALLADDPLARVDVPHFVRERGLALVGTQAEGSAWRFVVRAAAAGSESGPALAQS